MKKKLVAFNGSLRKSGNTSILLEHFLKGANTKAIKAEAFNVHELNLEYCRGCLRCNILGYCSIRDDDWATVAEKILDANVLVFATPIYFHHVSASMKKLMDRFRSFVKVQITETGLLHTPHTSWEKDFVLLLTMGSSDTADAAPVIDLFKYMTSILGPENRRFGGCILRKSHGAVYPLHISPGKWQSHRCEMDGIYQYKEPGYFGNCR